MRAQRISPAARAVAFDITPLARFSAYLAMLLAGFAPDPRAQALPDGITYAPAFGTDQANFFTHPGGLWEMPGKPGNFAVTEMGTGRIWVLSPGNPAYGKTLFGTVAGAPGEEDLGLSGFAFHPDYANNRKYYVKYGARNPRRLFLDERIAAADLLHDSGQPGRRLLTMEEPDAFGDHNGGSPAFGPDGFLYLGFGDGGWDQINPDPSKNGQNLETLLAKIIRIDVDHKDAGLEYAIPSDNPFAKDTNPKVRREIYAYGVRNPYRISFDRFSRELYLADIGYTKYDEVDIVKKGGNYGWSLKEGPYCLPTGPCAAVTEAIEDPALSLPNGDGAGMAKCIIGGHVYRGDPASGFYGAYLFGDYTLTKVFGFRKPSPGGAAIVKEYAPPPEPPIAFGNDALNNIYLVGYAGTIYRLEHPQLKPQATALERPSATGRKAVRAAFAWNGRVTLPPGARGAWEAFAPDGTRLGRIAAGQGNREVTPDFRAVPSEGLLLLVPADP